MGMKILDGAAQLAPSERGTMGIKAAKLTTLTPVLVQTATITSMKTVVIVYPDIPGMVRMTTDVNVLKVRGITDRSRRC